MSQWDAALEQDFLFWLVQFHAIEAGDEIEVPVGAAVLAIGGRAEAEFLLSGNGCFNAAVLHFPQFVVRQGSGLPGGACLPQRFGAKQAADMIGAEWRVGAGFWHGVLLTLASHGCR